MAYGYEFQFSGNAYRSNPWLAWQKLTRSELITYRNVDWHQGIKGDFYLLSRWFMSKEKPYPWYASLMRQFFGQWLQPEIWNLICIKCYFALRPFRWFRNGYPGRAWRQRHYFLPINKFGRWRKVDNDQVGVHGTSLWWLCCFAFWSTTNWSIFAASDQYFWKSEIFISFLGDSPQNREPGIMQGCRKNGQDRIWEARFGMSL